MAVKTLTIMEDAYDLLASQKKSGESFSDVIRRSFTSKKVTAADLFGKMKLSKKEHEDWKKELRDNRKQMNKEMEERRRVFARRFSDV